MLDMIDATLANEPMLNALANEPIEPTDRTDPTDPMESTESRDRIESTDPLEPMLQREVSPVSMPVILHQR